MNDGIATPIVTVALAAIAAEAGIQHEGGRHALLGLLLGALVGAVLGALGGILLRSARQRGWSSEDFAGPAILALALLAYLLAVLVDANGFVAAFVGGSAFGAFTGRGGTKGDLLRRADVWSRLNDLVAPVRGPRGPPTLPRTGTGASFSML